MKRKQAKKRKRRLRNFVPDIAVFWMQGKPSGNVSKRRCGWQRKKGIGNCRNAGGSNRETKYMQCTVPRPRYFFR